MNERPGLTCLGRIRLIMSINISLENVLQLYERVRHLDKESWATYTEERMRVGLLSDTHIPKAEKILPPEILEAFQGVGLILHAGDVFLPSVLDSLERIAPVLTASGDEEHRDMLTDKRVKEKHILKLEGQILWLVHERPYYLETTWWQDKLRLGQGQYENPDIVVFGHDHCPNVERVDGILYVCPGSPTYLNYHRGLGTVGILDIHSGEMNVRIVQL